MAMNCCELKVLKLYECQKYIVLKNESLAVVNLSVVYNFLNMILIRLRKGRSILWCIYYDEVIFCYLRFSYAYTVNGKPVY